MRITYARSGLMQFILLFLFLPSTGVHVMCDACMYLCILSGCMAVCSNCNCPGTGSDNGLCSR